jgi:hypothetical protein
MLRTIPGEVASRSGFTWWLSLLTWGGGGVKVDGLAWPLHWPTTRSYQARGQGLSAMHCLVLSLQ